MIFNRTEEHANSIQLHATYNCALELCLLLNRSILFVTKQAMISIHLVKMMFLDNGAHDMYLTTNEGRAP